jgi:hypothetical protein
MPFYKQGLQPTRTTLLEAVNVLLTNIGEQPVDQLDNQQILDARIAEETLLELHKEGQLRGWSWNSETAYPFVKDAVTKEIVVPGNVARFSPNPYAYGRRFVLRGQKVYDTYVRSTKLEDDITQVEADVVWILSYDDVPEAYNRWTTIRAARVFADRVLTNEAVFRFTAKDEMDAQTELERIELETQQNNILTDGYGYSPFPTYLPANGLANRRAGAGWRL